MCNSEQPPISQSHYALLPMTEPHPSVLTRQAEIDRLLKLTHLQSIAGPERAPFWRDGSWRCELHLSAGETLLKLFNGDSCVLQEPTSRGAIAHRRAVELRVFAYEASRLTAPGGKGDARRGSLLTLPDGEPET